MTALTVVFLVAIVSQISTRRWNLLTLSDHDCRVPSQARTAFQFPLWPFTQTRSRLPFSRRSMVVNGTQQCSRHTQKALWMKPRPRSRQNLARHTTRATDRRQKALACSPGKVSSIGFPTSRFTATSSTRSASTMIGTLLALGLLDSWQSLWPSSLSSSAPRRNFSAQRASPLYWLFIFGFQDFRISVTSAPSTPALFTQLRRSAFCILHCSLTIPTRHWRVGVQFATKVHCG
ncbi:hypothetical protein IWX47DRAFT_159254 [Phyllosticta citricarpa]